MICTVCGYIHGGDSSPDFCPLCGASADVFVPKDNKLSNPPIKRWRCLVCGFIHEGDEPPDLCPKCKAPSDRFELLVDQPVSEEKVNDNFLIIGGGIAGLTAAETLREGNPSAQISLICEEDYFPYHRMNLTRFLAGEVTEKELFLKPIHWYQKEKIDLYLGKKVEQIFCDRKVVTLSSGEELSYGKMLLATGASSFIPPVDGFDGTHVLSLRSKSDALEILERAKEATSCVCVGGGILGLELAGALRKRGKRVSVVEVADRLLPRQLNHSAAEVFEDYVTSLGIGVLKNARISRSTETSLIFESGKSLEGDLFILSAGVRSSTQLAKEVDAEVNHGVVVDSFLRTSVDDVWAAGDVCEHKGKLYGTWMPALYQGKIAALNMLGQATEFKRIAPSNLLKVLDFDLFSIGTFEEVGEKSLIFQQRTEKGFTLLNFSEGVLVGGILLGDISLAKVLQNHIEERTDFSALLEEDSSLEGIIQYIKE